MDWLLRRHLLRRALVWSALTIVGVALFILSAPLLALCVLRDLFAGTRLGATRGVVVLLLFVLMEWLGLLRGGWLWCRYGGPFIDAMGQRQRFQAANFALQRWWADSLWRWSRRILRVRVEVRGSECLRSDRPLLMLVRHASHADTLLPVHLLRPLGRDLRFVLKEELLLDPCLDLVGRRLPNAFVSRGGKDSSAQVAAVTSLVDGVSAKDAVVVFPEGTRVTERKRARVQERLVARGALDEAHLAQQLRYTLPPLRKGPLALLAARDDLDVVFVAHRGLEVATRLPNLLSGALVDGEITVNLWRVPAEEVPRQPADLRAFLAAHWLAVDALAGPLVEERWTLRPELRDWLSGALTDGVRARVQHLLVAASLPR